MKFFDILPDDEDLMYMHLAALDSEESEDVLETLEFPYKSSAVAATVAQNLTNIFRRNGVEGVTFSWKERS